MIFDSIPKALRGLFLLLALRTKLVYNTLSKLKESGTTFAKKKPCIWP